MWAIIGQLEEAFIVMGDTGMQALSLTTFDL
jgi:hypothetical protein